MQSNISDAQFRGNVLIVGKTGYGKTYFAQKLGLHNFFVKIVKVEWVSSVLLNQGRQKFSHDSRVEFYHAQDVEDLKELIETFKLRTENLVENESVNTSVYGENKIMDCLIVMDNVSGLADNCKEFEDFFTVTQKYRYHCVYVFHIIIPDKEVWKKIKYFKVTVCVPTATKYVPVRSMWINRVFINLVNQMKEIA